MLGAEAEDILEDNFINSKKKNEDGARENIKESFGFGKIKDACDEASVPQQLEF